MSKKIFFKSRGGGFTILEMLVVIALSGMIVMILLQALQHVMVLHHRFGVELDRNRQDAMRRSWLSQVMEGLQPDADDGDNKLQGSARDLKGMTNSAFTQHYGVPTPFTLKLRYAADKNRTVLEYSEMPEADKAIPLFSWAGRRGRFIYLDNRQIEHDSWPPELDHSQQIPNAIQLETERDGQPWLLSFKPAGLVNPPPPPIKMMSGVSG